MEYRETFLRDSNDFVVPFLSVVGTLDGGGIMYSEREYFETESMQGPAKNSSFFLVLEDVNHAQVIKPQGIFKVGSHSFFFAQVASGEVSEAVQETDIPAELTEEEAHKVYGEVSAQFLVINTPSEWWNADENVEAMDFLLNAKDETLSFISHLGIAHNWEEIFGDDCPWVKVRREACSIDCTGFPIKWCNLQESQRLLLGSELESLANEEGLELDGVILDNLNFQINQPEILPAEEGGFSIQTYTRLFHDLDLIDYGELQGASTIKVSHNTS